MNLIKNRNADFMVYIIIGLSIPLMLWFGYLNRKFELDDALIYLRYVDNFKNGYGLVYNIGEKFNGLTSPLYVYLLVIGSFFVSNMLILQTIVNSVLLWLCGFVGYLLLRNLKVPKISASLFILLYISQYFFYKVWGMESHLFMLLCFLLLYSAETRKYKTLYVVMGALILTRGEGVFLSFWVFVIYILMKNRLNSMKYLLVPALIVSANFIFNKIYYNHYLPQTLTAKIQQGKSGEWGGSLAFLYGFKHWTEHYFYGNEMYFCIVLVSGFLGCLLMIKKQINFAVLGFLGMLLVFYLVLNIPAYHWYFTPFMSFLLFYSVLGIARVPDLIKNINLRNKMYNMAAVILVLFCIIQISGSSTLLKYTGPQYLRYKQIGIWIRKNTPENAVLAAMEIGTLGYYSKRKMVDILGLINPYNAELIGNRNYSGWLDYYKPDYILVRDPMHQLEAGGHRAIKEFGYRKVKMFKFSGYQLLKKPADHK